MTIGYNQLGSNGRFANQMFQYAGLRGVAANKGYDFKVPPPGNYGRSDYALFECFEMGSVRPENFGFVDGGSIATGQFHFYHLDIENQQSVDALFEANKFSSVLNLAARAGVWHSMENPYVYMGTNTVGTLNLLEAMRRREVNKMVLASTSSLYAGQEMPFVETLPVITPFSPYAASKKAAEVMAYSYHNLYDLDISVVRYFTVYGPCSRPDMAIFRFLEWIEKETPIELFGDGEQSRDFTYIDAVSYTHLTLPTNREV